MKTLGIAGAIALLVSLTAPAVALDFHTVMVSGRPDGDGLGPQLSPGVDFSYFNGFSVNSSGQVAFAADLVGPGIVFDEGTENDTAIWRWTAGSKELLVRESAPVPGLPAGVLVNNLSVAGFDANGRELVDDGSLMSYMKVKGPGISEDANDVAYVRLNGPGAGSKVFQSGDVAPGTFVSMTRALTSFSMPSRDSSGNVMFRVQPLAGPGVTSSSNDSLVFGMDNNYSLLVREGQQPVGFPANFVYREFPQSQIAFSGNRFVFGAALHDNNDPDVDSLHQALFTGTPGSVELIAAAGDPLPDSSGSYFYFGNSRINSTGKILFDANNGYLAGSLNEGFQFVAKQGQSAPGTSETFGFLGAGSNGPTLSQLTVSGLVAFEATVSGSSDRDQGIWVHDGSSLELAIREGDAAGSLAGVTLGAFQDWAFNDGRNLVIKTALAGSGVGGGNDSALWLVSAVGEMNLLLREGDLFDVDPSVGVDERTITNFFIGGRDSLSGTDSKTNGLTDNNWLTVGLLFNDGTNGIVVTNLTVPEPATMAMMSLGTLWIIGFGRRRRWDVSN